MKVDPRPQIYIPTTSPRCVVKLQTSDGADVPGSDWRLMDPGESDAFTIAEGQRLVIEPYPEKEAP